MPIAAQRLFIALWPSEPVHSALAAAQQRWSWPPHAALVRPDKLHVTLHFLGNVAQDRIDELRAAIDIASPLFELRPHAQAVWRGGIAVLETDAPEPLMALHAALGKALAGIGLAVETRPYRPHVTLARHAQGALPPSALQPFIWPVHGHVLVRSAGGDYTVIA
jgi:RNA 2',3'-cyclic 3'-phosphodiesterase